jgi:hypothetical protein
MTSKIHDSTSLGASLIYLAGTALRRRDDYGTELLWRFNKSRLVHRRVARAKISCTVPRALSLSARYSVGVDCECLWLG